MQDTIMLIQNSKILEKGNSSIIFKNKERKCEHLLIIYMAENKSLMIKPKSENSKGCLKERYEIKRKMSKKDCLIL